MIDLPADPFEEVQAILGRLAPQCRVIAFGSRVPGRVKKFSDLDLAWSKAPSQTGNTAKILA